MNQHIIPEDDIPEGHRSGFVAVIGRPNVGKSTLMNAFLGQKVAIVTPRPQTTRTAQLGIITEPDYQIVFVDTPGLMQPRHKLDEFMLETATEQYLDADVILWLVDGSASPDEEEIDIAGNLRPLAEKAHLILAINKSDLLDPEAVIPRTDAYRALLPEGTDWLLFSAVTGLGVGALLEMILNALPEGPRYYPTDQVTDTYMRDLAAEMVREQLLIQLREEVPHGTVVQVGEFKERENGVIYISATIYVERETHKQIVIGKKGSQLRSIGQAARPEIEALTGSPVYLDLWVKVAPKWRRDENALKRFGYSKQG
jgi:GTP-binding protein Era